MSLSNPLTPDEQRAFDKGILQRAIKQGFQVAQNGASGLENNIKAVESVGNESSADLIAEARALLATLQATIDATKAQSGL